MCLCDLVRDPLAPGIATGAVVVNFRLFSVKAASGKMKRGAKSSLETSGSQKTADGVADESQLIITCTNACKQNAMANEHTANGK